MTTAATSLLGLALPVTGELQGTWGTTVNDSITSLLDTAVAGTTTLSTDGDVTLTTTTLASNQARQAILLCSGARTALRTITAPAQSKIYTIINATTGGFSVKLVGVGPTTGLTIPNGASAVVAWNGSDFIEIGSSTIGNLTVNGNLTVTGTSTLTGAATLTANPTLSAGTANGVAYLNGSKVLTTGSALTFSETGIETKLGIKSISGTSTYTAGIAVNWDDNAFILYGGSGYKILETLGYSTPNVLKFFTNNTEGMRLTSTGLGIGTSSPATRLQVVAASANSTGAKIGGILYSGTQRGLTIKTYQSNGGDDCGVEFNAADGLAGYGGFKFAANATTLATLDSSGNLGLGVTPSAWGSTYRMQQIGYGAAVGGRTAAAQAYLSANWYQDGTGNKYIYNGFATQYQQDSGVHYWFTAPSGTAGNAISFTQAMTLDASGNLGVGITSPATRLHVADTNYPYITVSNTTGTQIKNTFGANGITQVAYLGTTTNHPLGFLTNDTERARIDSSGNLLVGTTSQPVGGITARLAVSQSIADYSGIIVNSQSTAANCYGVRIQYTAAAPNGTGNVFLVMTDTGGDRAYFRSNGGLSNYSANNTNLSDARSKTDIQDAGSYLSKICAIPVRTFKYKDQSDDLLNLGVIAQEVEAVAPELVDVSGFGETPEDGIPLKSIYQTDLQYALMKCIQEQQALIVSMREELDALKAKVGA